MSCYFAAGGNHASRVDFLVERRGFEMMAIGAFGASKSMVVTFSPYSGAWRPNPPMVDFKLEDAANGGERP
jgi:hypothetical protein